MRLKAENAAQELATRLTPCRQNSWPGGLTGTVLAEECRHWNEPIFRSESNPQMAGEQIEL